MHVDVCTCVCVCVCVCDAAQHTSLRVPPLVLLGAELLVHFGHVIVDSSSEGLYRQFEW